MMDQLATNLCKKLCKVHQLRFFLLDGQSCQHGVYPYGLDSSYGLHAQDVHISIWLR